MRSLLLSVASVKLGVAVVSIALAASACSTPPAPASPASPPSPASPSDVHPAPFTAEQIRAATKPGRTYRWRVETEGGPTAVREITFVDVSAEGAVLRTSSFDEKGNPLGAPETSKVTWRELQSHAEFPRAAVTVGEGHVDVPAGSFDCVIYTVRSGATAGTVDTFSFAKNLPGAPVLFVAHRDGKSVKSTLLEHRPGH